MPKKRKVDFHVLREKMHFALHFAAAPRAQCNPKFSEIQNSQLYKTKNLDFIFQFSLFRTTCNHFIKLNNKQMPDKDGYTRQRCYPRKEYFPPTPTIPRNPTAAEAMKFYHATSKSGRSLYGNLRACAELIKAQCRSTSSSEQDIYL